jgi:hypothetical protein
MNSVQNMAFYLLRVHFNRNKTRIISNTKNIPWTQALLQRDDGTEKYGGEGNQIISLTSFNELF